jgi:N-acetyl-anhydromuramyl-L-alanine amidase AmpD
VSDLDIKWVGCGEGNFLRGRTLWQSASSAVLVPEIIVVHIMAGTETGTDDWFNRRQAHVSAHYGISRGGEIHRYVNEEDTAFHAGVVDNPDWQYRPGVNPNLFSIGIEHEGQLDIAWTDEQVQSSAKLVATVAKRWSIPLDAEHVVPHHAIRASKTCPGAGIDIEKLIAAAIAEV